MKYLMSIYIDICIVVEMCAKNISFTSLHVHLTEVGES